MYIHKTASYFVMYMKIYFVKLNTIFCDVRKDNELILNGFPFILRQMLKLFCKYFILLKKCLTDPVLCFYTIVRKESHSF